MERLTAEQIEAIIQTAKERCPYYGEPNGCNAKSGPLDCCDNLDDLGELAKAAAALGTVEHLTELVKAEQKRQKGCGRCWNGECTMSGFDYSCETTCDQCRYNLKDKQFCPHCGRDLRGESHDGDRDAH